MNFEMHLSPSSAYFAFFDVFFTYHIFVFSGSNDIALADDTDEAADEAEFS